MDSVKTDLVTRLKSLPPTKRDELLEFLGATAVSGEDLQKMVQETLLVHAEEAQATRSH